VKKTINNVKEVKGMRKTLMIVFAVLLSVVLVYGYANAIQGVCSNCHTMHNSQHDSQYSGAMGDGPNGYLLRYACVACHSGSNADFSTNGGKTGWGAPIVLRSDAAPGGQGGTNTLAGGDFYWVANGSDAKGHNVADINGVGQDSNIGPTLGYTPPGWDPDASSGLPIAGQVAGGEASWSSQLTCAGKYGCHGDHTKTSSLDGIYGAHHQNPGTDTQVTNPTNIGESFRFLGNIKGLENNDWNYDETASDHNEYYGVDGNANYANKDTISYLCAECHGVFHSSIGSSSPWIRHPTDIDLACTGSEEYCSYNPDNNNVYSVEAPVARATVPASASSTVTPSGNTDDIVMCLSCHRAHGSPQDDLLRWNYSTIQAGQGTTDNGCFVCHTSKNAD
jgi:predicted CXXCH cytochrome family protein